MRAVMSAKLSVRVHARARRDELLGVREGVLVVRVTAPALEGRANRAVCQLLAKQLGIAPSRLTIAHGQHSRDKVVEVRGVDQTALEAALSEW